MEPPCAASPKRFAATLETPRAQEDELVALEPENWIVDDLLPAMVHFGSEACTGRQICCPSRKGAAGAGVKCKSEPNPDNAALPVI